MRTTSRRIIASAVLSLSVLAAGCDPGRAVDGGEEGEVAPTRPAMAIEGQVVEAATTAVLAGARVQVLHVGSGSTDESGVYRFGEAGALAGLEFLSLRVEAPGYAPVERRVDLVHGRASMPVVRLTRLTQAMPLGPGGGEIAFSNGTQVRAPVGAVGASVEVSVTLLAQGGYGPIEPEKPALAFHVSPEGTRFARPVRVTVPLERPAPPRSTMPLYSFDGETGSWISAGSATVSMDGGFVEAPVEEGETYAFLLTVDWGSEQVSVSDVYRYEKAGDWACLPAHNAALGISLPETSRFKTSVSSAAFPNFHAHLKSLYDFTFTPPGVTVGPYVVDRRVVAWKVYEKHWRKGRVWHLATPANKTTYTYEYWTFVGWDVRSSECDVQGGG